jgi:transglutaminase-like putative cysteine protease
LNRREFVIAGASAGAAFSLGRVASALEPAQGWRTFEITSQVEILKPDGATRMWVPAPLAAATPFQRHIRTDLQHEASSAILANAGSQRVPMVHAEFPAGSRASLTVTSKVATRDWAVLLPGSDSFQSTRREPAWPEGSSGDAPQTDDLVRKKAASITKGAETQQQKAREIYEWIVANTYRNPRTRGCGRGDVKFMLESGDLGGKCADINALFVALARGCGLQARDVYGIRVAPSRLGYRSLGPSTTNITKAQHCRAEVYLDKTGWTPVDPADVRKVILEEPPGQLPATNEKVRAAESRLFGSWEMNWVAYNYAQDVDLPGSKFGPVRFFMYPQAETRDGRIDCLDPDNFRYQITSREI